MIVFNLNCAQDHAFEAWFKDGSAYDSQRRARKIACPLCGNTKISKLPTAPRLNKGRAARVESAAREMAEAAQWREQIKALKDHVISTCEDVGPRFAEEARKIHTGESEERGIYGEATVTEAQELTEEGVPFTPLPKLPEGDA
jgi:hypothetical protein